MFDVSNEDFTFATETSQVLEAYLRHGRIQLRSLSFAEQLAHIQSFGSALALATLLGLMITILQNYHTPAGDPQVRLPVHSP